MAFTAPCKNSAASYVAAMREGLHLGPRSAYETWLAENHFIIYKLLRRLRRPMDTTLWLTDGGHFIGTLTLRTRLSPSLLRRGGHLSYAVRASERRKGHGDRMVREALRRLRALGLSRILVTCHDENLGSIRLIEKNGGVLQDKVQIPGYTIPERRYWIEL